MTDPALGSAHARFRTWLFEQALPFWGGPGHEGAGRGAREHLRLDGTPADVPFKRMRVQARQVYVFSQAALLGWAPGEALARDGYRFITDFGAHPQGGWVRQVSPSGAEVLDPAIDLYDQAFVLFALAWYARLTGEAAPLHLARRTVEWIRANMAAPHGGYLNVVPVEPGPRLQNPHMHLLEALLALYETSGDDVYARLAHELVDLFRRHLFDRETGALGEYFAAEWAPAAGEAGDQVEPGHHYEWVWLLDQYEQLTGGRATAELEALYRFAWAHGTDPVTSLVWDGVTRRGAVRSRSIRLWPQTEALRAHATMARRGWDTAATMGLVVDNLLNRFFAHRPAGTWMDQFDAAGAPVSSRIPTSSLYHVMTAYAEFDRLVVK